MNEIKPAFLSSLYSIADFESCQKHGIDVVDFCRAVFDGGGRVLQYRDKRGTDEKEVRTNWDQIHRLAEKYKSTVIINDHVELALEYGALLHAGQDTLKIPAEIEFGRSTHNIEEINQALCESPSAAYIGLGAAFSTPLKPHLPALTPEIISEAIRLWSKPIVFIGGITIDNFIKLPAQERFFYAIISDFFSLGSDLKSVKKYTERFLQKSKNRF